MGIANLTAWQNPAKRALLYFAIGTLNAHQVPRWLHNGACAGFCVLNVTRANSPLPDFFIGAHAETDGLTLFTRDVARYRTYFPSVKLIAPKDSTR